MVWVTVAVTSFVLVKVFVTVGAGIVKQLQA